MATTINGSTGASQIQDDIVTEDKLNLISTASVPSLEAKGSGSQDGYIQLNCYANTHGIKLKSPPHSAGASYTLTFPNNDGDADQFLQTNGSGVMSWAAPSGGGVTLLSTVATTSGTSNATGTLDLTGFKFVYIDCYSIRPATDSAGYLRFTPNGGTGTYFLDVSRTAAGAVYFGTSHNLDSGFFYGSKRAGGGGGINDTTRNGISNSDCMGHNTGLSTATTSISFDYTTGEAFQGGTIRIYGLK
jgi:hypothetical protein